ncbi:hypothetical protein KA478_02975 [Patescibacteria group bacterium]|nr:hypothetical protein [Patescibacteria group bacterium]
MKVENNDGFTRYLVMTSTGEPIVPAEDEADEQAEDETYSPNVNIISKAREKHKKQIVTGVQSSSVIEYFYLESPRIPEKFFPLRVYGIFDRVTIDDEKLHRIKEDIIKILAMTKKF